MMDLRRFIPVVLLVFGLATVLGQTSAPGTGKSLLTLLYLRSPQSGALIKVLDIPNHDDLYLIGSCFMCRVLTPRSHETFDSF